MKKTAQIGQWILFACILVLSIIFLLPILIVIMNSFKGKLYISDMPFNLPTSDTFAGFTNYINGLTKTGFLSAFGWSTFITVFSVLIIVLLTAMTAWFITRINNKFTNLLYTLFAFSMIVPFQMVMFTLTKVANS